MAGELDPRTRKEVFLSGMLYGDPEDLPDPETRDELYMKAIGEAIKAGGLPDPSEASEGDVLAIGSDGPEWTAPAGDKLYCHNISYTSETCNFTLSLVSKDFTPFRTVGALAAYLNSISNGITVTASGSAKGSLTPADRITVIRSITATSINGVEVKGNTYMISTWEYAAVTAVNLASSVLISDTVYEI